MLFCQMFLRSFENELDLSTFVFFTAEKQVPKKLQKVEQCYIRKQYIMLYHDFEDFSVKS